MVRVHSPHHTILSWLFVCATLMARYVISKREFAIHPEVDPMLALGCETLILTSLNASKSVALLDRHTIFEGPRIHAWCLLERPADGECVRRVHVTSHPPPPPTHTHTLHHHCC
jgi:hypothetical protein